jgi:hypothetical protein
MKPYVVRQQAISCQISPGQGRDEIVAGARWQRNGSVAEISRGIAIARRELGDLRSQLLM